MTAQLTTDQLTLLRGGGYEGSAYLVAGPQAVIFAARVNGTPAASDFAQITYDTVTVGAYTDIRVDQDIRISRTGNVRDSFFYGRIRKTPTSSILYINETSAAIADNDYIHVVDSYPLVIRQRYRTFVDWDKAYEPLPPIESNVPSASVVLTTAATAEFSFASVGQALEKGATVTGVLWDIPNATYTTGSTSTANITIEVDTPYNQWGHLTLTDSEGTTNTLHFTLTAGDPNSDSFFRLCHDPVPVSSDWNNGFTSSATYWSGIDDLLDRTRITLVTDERFDGDVLGVSNIAFIGYLRNSTSSTQGDATYGQRKDAALDFSGLLQLAGNLRFNQIAIRHSATPTAWDYINTPTPQRNIVHVIARHSTVLNLCSLSLGTIDDTFSSGNVNVEETSITDAARRSAKEINGNLIQAANGIVSLVRDPRIGSNAYRATLPDKTPSAIDLGDAYSYKLTVEPYDRVGWMDVGFAVFHPTTFTPTFLVANAPASGPGDGQENGTDPSQLLESTADLNDALAEARQRTADLYARENTRRTLEVNFGSGWGSVVNATPGVYYQFSIDAADDVRGSGVSSSDDWLCVSVNTTINRGGTQDTIGQFTEVTQGGDALISVSISPSVIDTPIPVLPVIAAYPAFPPAPSINYDSTDPTTRIPRDPFTGMQTTPLSTEEAAQAAGNQPPPGCRVQNPPINFRNASNVTSGFTTTLGAEYTVTVSGFAQIETPVGTDWAVEETYGSGVGTDAGTIVSQTLTSLVATPDLGVGSEYRLLLKFKNYVGGDATITAVNSLGGMLATYHGSGSSMFGGSYVNSALAAGQTLNYMYLTSLSNYTLNLSWSDGPALPTDYTYADAFYTWNLDTDGSPMNVQLNGSGGLYMNNAPIAVPPPFDPNHEYTFTYAGDGNPIISRFEDADHTDNQSAILYMTVCGPGAGE